MYHRIQPSVKTISEKERKELGSVTRSLNGNVGCWDGMIKTQYKILETAEKEEVLENTTEGRENLLAEAPVIWIL